MPKFVTNQVVETNPIDHPAVKFWRELGSDRVEPEAIVILKERRKKKKGKSAVYRLEGVGPAGTGVIAKRCQQATATIERTIYEDILPSLPVPTLEYFGSVEESNSDFCWLFLEDAGGEAYLPQVEEHRTAAAQWLGLMHISAAQVAGGPNLPDHGPGHYQNRLRQARETILGNLSNPALNSEDLTVLESIISLSNVLEPRWKMVEGFCQRFPRTLVHGDFVTKNVRFRNGFGAAAVVPFDWETAGWGVPATDLRLLDLSTYWSVIQGAWSDVSIQDIQRLAKIGDLFTCLDSISWSSQWLEFQWVERAMRHMRSYESQLAVLVRTAE